MIVVKRTTRLSLTASIEFYAESTTDLKENDESGGLILVTVEILIPAVNSMGCSSVVLFSKSREFRLTAFNLLPNQKPDKCIFRLCSRL
jgi:hypothetical protein